MIPNPVSIAQSASQYKILETIFAATAVVQKCLGANPNRVAVIFSDASGNINIATLAANVGSNKGTINLTASVPVFTGTFDWLGPWVQGDFFCCRLSGSSSLGITEIIYSPSG